MSHFIPEPSTFAEVTRLPADVKKALVEATLKDIKIVIINQTFLMDGPEKGDPVTPYIYVYKNKIQSGWSLDKLKLIIIVLGYL